MSNQIPNFTDKDAFAEYLGVDEAELQKRVQRFADANYLASTTGINSRELNAAKSDIGIFDWTGGSESEDNLLSTYGYNKNNYGDYYTNADFDPVDQGAAVLSEQYKKAALVEAKIEAEYQEALKTNPNAKKANLLSNDFGAQSAFLADYMATQGSFTTNAIVKPANAEVTAAADAKLNDLTKNSSFYTAFGQPASETLLNMREWDAYLAEKPEEPKDEIQQPVDTGAVTTGGYNPTADTTPAITAFTPDPNTFEIPAEATQPYYNPSRATIGGTFTQPAETFASNVTRQGTAYSARAPQQAKYYQPQTIQELQAADALQKEKTGTEGTSVSAYQLSQKLYRNPSTGHQLYIAFRGESPISPIPQGYYPVDMSGETAGNISLSAYNPVTAGGNTVQGVNQGGMIQGYQEGNFVTQQQYADAANYLTDTFKLGQQNYGQMFLDNPTGYADFNKAGGSKISIGTVSAENFTPEILNTINALRSGATVKTTDTGGNTDGTTDGTTGEGNGNSNLLPAEQTGTVSFQDPVSGQVVSQNVPEYIQTQQNIAAQKTINPASAIAPMGVQYMREVDAAGNLLMPGTVLESTAGQALPTAPMVGGDQIAQVQGITQARGADSFNPQALLEASGTQSSANPFIYDQEKNKYVAYGDGELANTIISEMTPAQFASAFQLNLGDYAKAPGAAQMNLTQASPAVKANLANLTAAQLQAPIYDEEGKVIGYKSSPSQLISGQTDYTSSVTGLDAATKTSATDVTAPTDRILQRTREPLTTTDAQGNVSVIRDTDGNIMYKGSELISGTGVDQSKVDTAFGTGQVTAASLTGELATLMKDFEGGDTPAWAAGAMRQATAIMNERGLGASTMAGQAIVQAAMESALPIAQVEAGNKQQIALFNGEQRAKFLGIEFDQTFQAKVQNAARVSEIANLNFTAKQTIALENSRAANTVNLADMSNRQAVVMAEAAALSQLDMASLSNLQQAAVQNAQNFLQVDMANLTNSQQTAIFKAQTQSQALLSDTSQANAAAQFNATSENQTTQFMSNLTAQVSQFNAAQQNAINQFNAEEANAVLEFNSALQNQREMFNAQNYLVVAQANAAWRQGINTTNTEAQNLSNAQYAKDVNGLSQQALDNFWQKERDLMNFAFAEGESQKDRALRILLGEADQAFAREQLDLIEQENKTAFFMDLFLPKNFSLTDAFSFGK